MPPTKLLLASPRGYCAGVDRAVDTVERALEHFGAPVYVRKEIVHNHHVVSELTDRGAVFVDSELDVPEGAVVVLSAHGVAPEVYGAAASAAARAGRDLPAGHQGARRGAKIRRPGLFDRPDRPRGPRGGRRHHGRGAAIDPADRIGGRDRSAADPRPHRVAYITQTTLSVDETLEIIAALRERFPTVVGPKNDDICYATQNRQNAVKQLAQDVDLVLVIGSRNSSNSNRLVDVTRELGVPAHLIDDETGIDPAWFEGVTTVGITSGASAPESLVTRVVEYFRELGVTEIDSHDAGGRERPLPAADAAAPRDRCLDPSAARAASRCRSRAVRWWRG